MVDNSESTSLKGFLRNHGISQWAFLKSGSNTWTAEAQRLALLAVLRRLAGHNIDVAFTENNELLVGLCISAGACLLHANLRDELEFFTKAANPGA